MEWVETTGRTLEAAVEAALDELGVNEDELEYEVLAEPKTGFLGRFGGSEARIRARVRPISREKPGDRRRRRRDDRKRGERDQTDRAGSDRPDDGSGRRSTAGGDAGDRAGSSSGRSGSTSAGGSGSRNRRRGRGGGGGSASPGIGARQQSRSSEDETMSDSAVPLDEQVEVATDFTRGLIERFGLTADIQGRSEGDDDVFVDVTGSDLGVLIGPKGATIDAMQELVRTAVQHRTGGFTARMHVDVGGYRAARHEALAEFARSVAQRAIESGRDQALEPMNSADRKVVHDAVSEIDGVTTISEGEDPRRRVVIRPA